MQFFGKHPPLQETDKSIPLPPIILGAIIISIVMAWSKLISKVIPIPLKKGHSRCTHLVYHEGYLAKFSFKSMVNGLYSSIKNLDIPILMWVFFPNHILNSMIAEPTNHCAKAHLHVDQYQPIGWMHLSAKKAQHMVSKFKVYHQKCKNPQLPLERLWGVWASHATVKAEPKLGCKSNQHMCVYCDWLTAKHKISNKLGYKGNVLKALCSKCTARCPHVCWRKWTHSFANFCNIQTLGFDQNLKLLLFSPTESSAPKVLLTSEL